MGLFSGRQVAHPTDCFIRNVALICLAVLGGLLLYDRVNETQKQPGKPKTTLDCWFPAQLTDNQIKTGTKMCLIQESHWVLDKAWNPRMDRNKTKVNVFPSIHGASKNIFYQTATIMEIFVTSQVVLVVVAFLLLRNVACRAGTQARVLVAGLGGSPLQVDAARGLRRGFCTTVTYILIQVGYFIGMVVMVTKLRQLPVDMWTGTQTEFLQPKPQSKQFICDFDVKQLGNVQRYSAQCVSTWLPPDPLPNSTLNQLVLYLDTVLCGAVALMILLHLFQTLLLSSASSDVIAAYDLQKPPGLAGRLVFGFTDMNLAAIFLNVIGHPHVVMMGTRNDRSNEAHGYSDTIQMDPTFRVDSSLQKPPPQLV